MELLSIPAIVAAVEALKAAFLPSKFASLTAVALGIVFGWFFVEANTAGIGAGLVLGLAASGLYSGAKSVFR